MSDQAERDRIKRIMLALRVVDMAAGVIVGFAVGWVVRGLW